MNDTEKTGGGQADFGLSDEQPNVIYLNGHDKDLDEHPADVVDPADPRGKLPRIKISRGTQAHMSKRAEAILVKQGVDIYQRGERLVMPIIVNVPASNGRLTQSAALRPVSAPVMRGLLSKHMAWRRWDKQMNRWVYADPPKEVIEILLASYGDWEFRPLAGILSAPTMRPDGTILEHHGYDARTRMFLLDPPKINVPKAPTREDAEDALKLIRRLFVEFPFVDEVSESVALAEFITAIVRLAFITTPGFGYSATSAGTGKTFLVDLVAAGPLGAPCPAITAGEGDIKEMEKRLTSMLIVGYPMVNIDNINGELGGELLCRALSEQVLNLRILGKNDNNAKIPNTVLISATGNNLQPVGDVVRRVLMCWMDAGVEQPELRPFKSNPVHAVLEDRGRYISAALTIVRAYILAGKPKMCGPFANYEDWSTLVRSPLVWLGMSDPVRSVTKSREGDTELITIRMIHAAMRGAFGDKPVMASEIIAVSKEDDEDDLREALSNIPTKSGQKLDGRALGMWFKKIRNKPVGAWKLSCKVDPKWGNKWYICSSDLGDTVDDG